MAASAPTSNTVGVRPWRGLLVVAMLLVSLLGSVLLVGWITSCGCPVYVPPWQLLLNGTGASSSGTTFLDSFALTVERYGTRSAPENPAGPVTDNSWQVTVQVNGTPLVLNAPPAGCGAGVRFGPGVCPAVPQNGTEHFYLVLEEANGTVLDTYPSALGSSGWTDSSVILATGQTLVIDSNAKLVGSGALLYVAQPSQVLGPDVTL